MIETISIHGKDHPTYAGILNKAHQEGLESIKTELLQAPLAENAYMAIIKATVTIKGKTFEGIGDATPKNVNSMIAPHIVRMAETRAKGRALRDALNISEALAEELMDESTNRPYDRTIKSQGKKGGEVHKINGLSSICSIHNSQMQEKDGQFGPYWSHMTDDKLYWCNGKKLTPVKGA